ncbi:hypothetical protein JCGZ_06041 [Jatropha curcas]|uniref:Uncharacterized protein n=1 Tax=Jatropha curcas TaxID=180498 RepID=A0A067J9H2_JATCU|nr:hypothetical protein JCGZ_06041 [Jatropha curcas]
MERGVGIASIALAETILSLDQAYRVDGIWTASPILLQMGHVQGLSPVGALFQDTLISPRITVAILGDWSRGPHMVEAGASGGGIAAYQDWCVAEHD